MKTRSNSVHLLIGCFLQLRYQFCYDDVSKLVCVFQTKETAFMLFIMCVKFFLMMQANIDTLLLWYNLCTMNVICGTFCNGVTVVATAFP